MVQEEVRILSFYLWKKNVLTLGIDNAHLTQRKRRFRKGRTDNYTKRGRYDKASKTDQNPVDQDGNKDVLDVIQPDTLHQNVRIRLAST